jgi:hypothetical protein
MKVRSRKLSGQRDRPTRVPLSKVRKSAQGKKSGKKPYTKISVQDIGEACKSIRRHEERRYKIYTLAGCGTENVGMLDKLLPPSLIHCRVTKCARLSCESGCEHTTVIFELRGMTCIFGDVGTEKDCRVRSVAWTYGADKGMSTRMSKQKERHLRHVEGKE